MISYTRTLARIGGVVLLAGAAVLAGDTSKAEAAFVLAICDDAACDGAGDIFVQDESANDLAPGFAGIISVSSAFSGLGGVGGFDVEITGASTKPSFGSAANPAINLTYQLTNVSPGAAQAWVYAGDTDYTGQGNIHLDVNSTTGGQDTTGLALGGDDNNVDLISGLNLAPLQIAVGPFPGVFSASGSGGPVGAAPYALTAGVLISRPGTGLSSGDITVTVPEPATMALFGLGLFGAGLAARRRRAVVQA